MFYFFILIVDMVTVCYNYSLNSLRADDINTVAYSYPRLLKIKYLFAKISLTGFERMLSNLLSPYHYACLLIAFLEINAVVLAGSLHPVFIVSHSKDKHVYIHIHTCDVVKNLSIRKPRKY